MYLFFNASGIFVCCPCHLVLTPLPRTFVGRLPIRLFFGLYVVSGGVIPGLLRRHSRCDHHGQGEIFSPVLVPTGDLAPNRGSHHHLEMSIDRIRSSKHIDRLAGQVSIY